MIPSNYKSEKLFGARITEPVWVPMSQIKGRHKINKFDPRTADSALLSSFRSEGQQEPGKVTATFEVIDGGRRFDAAQRTNQKQFFVEVLEPNVSDEILMRICYGRANLTQGHTEEGQIKVIRKYFGDENVMVNALVHDGMRIDQKIALVLDVSPSRARMLRAAAKRTIDAERKAPPRLRVEIPDESIRYVRNQLREILTLTRQREKIESSLEKVADKILKAEKEILQFTVGTGVNKADRIKAVRKIVARKR